MLSFSDTKHSFITVDLYESEWVHKAVPAFTDNDGEYVHIWIIANMSIISYNTLNLHRLKIIKKTGRAHLFNQKLLFPWLYNMSLSAEQDNNLLN